MATPVISTVTSPVAVGNQAVVIGANFGRVSSCALVDTTTDEIFEIPDFIVDHGGSIHLTVPRSTPVGFYDVLLGTLDNEHSDNLAGAVHVILAPLPLPAEPIFPTPGTTLARIRTRLRYELGDYEETFTATVASDGTSRRYDLPAEAVLASGLSVVVGDQTLTDADYTLEGRAGVLTLDAAPPEGTNIYVYGTRAQFLLDDELDMFIESALLKHGHNATFRVVTRDPVTGRTTYTTDALALANLPAVEEHPLAILATIEALWALAADASYDIDVSTAEGTSLPRQERYRAIMQMISAQQERYDFLVRQLGVGLGRLEMFTLRRVSRTTGRYVPIYQDREYDEHTPPMRVYPPVDTGLSGTGTQHRTHIGQQYPPGP